MSITVQCMVQCTKCRIVAKEYQKSKDLENVIADNYRMALIGQGWGFERDKVLCPKCKSGV